jgi:hypothetical protein
MLKLVVRAVTTVLSRVNQMSKYELVKQGSLLCYSHVFHSEILKEASHLARLMQYVNKHH